VKQGLKLVATSIFLVAALLTTGCGENALMNPVGETVDSSGTVNAGGQVAHPGGQVAHP
jgi:hypothetical protein